MASQVIVFLGPARSGKTHELMRQYRLVLDRNPQNGSERSIWLAPNGRTAAAVREQLVTGGLAASLRPGIVTFDDLTAQILIAANVRLRRLDAVSQRELLRRVVAQAAEDGKLSFLADAASRPGFILLLAEHIAELKRREIGPDAYEHTESPRATDQHGELAMLYADYESMLATHGLIDRESPLGCPRCTSQ